MRSTEVRASFYTEKLLRVRLWKGSGQTREPKNGHQAKKPQGNRGGQQGVRAGRSRCVAAGRRGPREGWVSGQDRKARPCPPATGEREVTGSAACLGLELWGFPQVKTCPPQKLSQRPMGTISTRGHSADLCSL